MQRYLDMAVDPLSGVRKQDGSSVISSIAGNSVGRYLVWNWIRTKWSVVSTYFDTAISSSVGKMVTACAKVGFFFVSPHLQVHMQRCFLLLCLLVY